MNRTEPIRILSFLPDALPTHRADVAILAGKYLPRLGVLSHFVGTPRMVGSEIKELPHDVQSEVSRAAKSRLIREWHYVKLVVRRLVAADAKRYEVIQVRDMVGIGLLALLFARLKGIPFVYWMSFLMCEGRLDRARMDWQRGRKFKAALLHIKASLESQLLYRLLLPACQFVFVQSEGMKRYVNLKIASDMNMLSVPMGVDTSAIAAADHKAVRFEHMRGVPLIGYLGTLDAQRKLHLLVDALVSVRRRFPDACLLFVGSSDSADDEHQLRRYVEKSGLNDAVAITGWLPTTRAWELILGCDVCVSPIPRSLVLDASSPTKLLEYMALGMPSIGNDNPDQKVVLDESEAGWLVAGEKPDYASAILAVLSDMEAARSRAARGPAYVAEKRSYEMLSNRVALAYRKILERD